MKRFWFVLFALGLITTFSTQALAVDVKFSGSYYAAGMYLDKTTLRKDTATDGPSTAFYFQRLRVGTEFIVAPGLSLITRFDAMERSWGATRTVPGTTLDSLSAGTRAENENIAFDYAYIQYASSIGILAVGYMNNNDWGTVFGNSQGPAAKASFILPIGFDLTVMAQVVKVTENSRTAINPSATFSDADTNEYYLIATYNWKYVTAGVLGVYGRNAETRPLGWMISYYMLEPYATAKFGPVSIQAELQYAWSGHFVKFENNIPLSDQKLSNWAGWIDITASFGPVYVGGSFAYVAGDNPDTTDTVEGGILTGGADWNPCLILWNYDRTYWAGSLAGQGTSVNSDPMVNAFFYQGRVGVKPIDKLDILASVSYAYADKKPTGYVSNEYGWEVDLTATYKITNNLSYMLGIGYLFTGDYFKGEVANASVNNDFLVLNKLTLTF